MNIISFCWSNTNKPLILCRKFEYYINSKLFTLWNRSNYLFFPFNFKWNILKWQFVLYTNLSDCFIYNNILISVHWYWRLTILRHNIHCALTLSYVRRYVETPENFFSMMTVPISDDSLFLKFYLYKAKLNNSLHWRESLYNSQF